MVIHALGMMDAPDAHAASRRPARRRRILLTVTNEYPLGQADFESASRWLGRLLLFFWKDRKDKGQANRDMEKSADKSD